MPPEHVPGCRRQGPLRSCWGCTADALPGTLPVQLRQALRVLLRDGLHPAAGIEPLVYSLARPELLPGGGEVLPQLVEAGLIRVAPAEHGGKAGAVARVFRGPKLDELLRRRRSARPKEQVLFCAGQMPDGSPCPIEVVVCSEREEGGIRWDEEVGDLFTDAKGRLEVLCRRCARRSRPRPAQPEEPPAPPAPPSLGLRLVPAPLFTPGDDGVYHLGPSQLHFVGPIERSYSGDRKKRIRGTVDLFHDGQQWVAMGLIDAGTRGGIRHKGASMVRVVPLDAWADWAEPRGGIYRGLETRFGGKTWVFSAEEITVAWSEPAETEASTPTAMAEPDLKPSKKTRTSRTTTANNTRRGNPPTRVEKVPPGRVAADPEAGGSPQRGRKDDPPPRQNRR